MLEKPCPVPQTQTLAPVDLSRYPTGIPGIEKMEPDDTIDAVRSKDAWSHADVDCLRDLAKQFPGDPYLWDVLGDVSQMVDQSAIGNEYSLRCYLNAIAADPKYGPAHNSLGHWYDIAEDYPKAKHHFEIAIDLGVGDPARIGLAQILAQMGFDNDAYAILDDCDDASVERVAQVRREIADRLLGPYVELKSEQHNGG